MWKSSKTIETKLTAEETGLDFASGLDPAHESYAVTIVDRILKAAVAAHVTDIHFELNRERTLLALANRRNT